MELVYKTCMKRERRRFETDELGDISDTNKMNTKHKLRSIHEIFFEKSSMKIVKIR